MVKIIKLNPSEYKKSKEITDERGRRELIISLSINGGEADEFPFRIHHEKAEKLEALYRECSQKEDFDNAKFWHWLQENEPELAHDVRYSIEGEFMDSYIFSEEGFHYDLDVMRPDDCFPLRDLHFVYLNDEEEVIQRCGDCCKTIIYGDNIYDCDFSCTFDD